MGNGQDGPRRRAAVIIGGGIMGTSVACHLARAGVTEVTVLESGELGGGSSAKPLGGVRAFFSDATNIALGARSLEAFRRFGAEVGTDIGWQQVGYLFAIRDQADVAGFEASVALQNSMGVPSRLVEVGEAARHCRYLTGSQVVAAVWSPGDGFARPAAVVRGYADVAAALGVEVRTRTAVTAIEATANGQALVHTRAGDLLTPTVVCAAGASSQPVGAMVGVDLPIQPLRRQITFTPPPPAVPFTIAYSGTAYFHGSEDGGLLMGWADPYEAPGFAARSAATGTARYAMRCVSSSPRSPRRRSAAAGPGCTR